MQGAVKWPHLSNILVHDSFSVYSVYALYHSLTLFKHLKINEIQSSGSKHHVFLMCIEKILIHTQTVVSSCCREILERCSCPLTISHWLMEKHYLDQKRKRNLLRFDKILFKNLFCHKNCLYLGQGDFPASILTHIELEGCPNLSLAFQCLI